MKKIYQSTGLLKPMTIEVDLNFTTKQRADAIIMILTRGRTRTAAQALNDAAVMLGKSRGRASR